ncbi:hypothetical protein M1555_02945 [Patescibacteria group bacterium]|nr:hypothetical protein [Patescibacteria group bacterium]
MLQTEVERLLYYESLFGQFGGDQVFTAGMLQHFLEMRRELLPELTQMKGLVEMLRPVPPYLVYAAPVPLVDALFMVHGVSVPFLTQAILLAHESDGRIVLDQHNRPVIAANSAAFPVSDRYERAIHVSQFEQLPLGHPAKELFALTADCTAYMIHHACSAETLYFLLAEGVGEEVTDIKQTITWQEEVLTGGKTM